jgi:hypothetical protein
VDQSSDPAHHSQLLNEPHTLTIRDFCPIARQPKL